MCKRPLHWQPGVLGCPRDSQRHIVQSSFSLAQVPLPSLLRVSTTWADTVQGSVGPGNASYVVVGGGGLMQ